MSQPSFDRVLIIGRPTPGDVAQTLQQLIDYLKQQDIAHCVEQQTAKMLAPTEQQRLASQEQIIDLTSLQPQNDLLLVIGGDGSMLHATQASLHLNLPILGINRGQLGFLTDINPQQIHSIANIMRGQYQREQRLMITAELYDQDANLIEGSKTVALNDIVLTPGNVAHMISFAISINRVPVCQQRADGLIITTPTGSTAYALSAGGPILHPDLNAMALVPLLSHKLSSRPLVIDAHAVIDIEITQRTRHNPAVSTDGSDSIYIKPGYRIRIQSCPQRLSLLHPMEYEYYNTLGRKLGWERIPGTEPV